jgi:polyhydroxyalkanoate synthesis regulator phasin
MANEPNETTEAPAKVEDTTATTTPEPDKSPGWEGEFNPDRAARLVSNLREESKKAKDELTELKSKLAEKEDAEKSELQRIQERAERAEAELNATRSALLIAEVAKEYGVPADLISGKDREEIEARAKALADWAGASKRPADDVPSRPKPKLVSGAGASGNDDEPFDPVATAAKIRARY